MVVGDRSPETLAHFSPVKRWLPVVRQLGGVRGLSGTSCADAAEAASAPSRAVRRCA
jgi:hypothetical protein